MALSSGHDRPRADLDTTNDRKWWKHDGATAVSANRSQKGESCPKCQMDDLDWDSLFRLHCPNCGYVAECGAFT